MHPLLAIPNPPAGMTTPHTGQQVIFGIVTALIVVLFAFSLREWKRTGRPTMTLLILGGAVCSLNESLGDVLGHCYFPTAGAWEAQTLLGRTIPIWVDVTYMSFFGAFPYLLSLVLRRVGSRRNVWLAIIAFWVANVVLEIPLLGSHLYVYYGQWPLKVAGFPLFWMTINCLGAFFAGVVALVGERFFTGRRQLLLLLVPFACYMSSWVVDMPGFWVLNSGQSVAVRYVFVALAMLLAVAAIDGLIRASLAYVRWREAGDVAAAPTPITPLLPADPVRA